MLQRLTATLLAGLLATPLLAAPALPAQGVELGGGDVLGEEYGDEHPGVMGRVEHGEFTGDARQDAVVTLGEEYVLIFGPGLYESLITLPLTGNDIVTLEGAGPGNLDALAMVSERGLERWAVDMTAGAFETVAIGGPAWVSGQRLTSGDFDADGNADVLGTNAAGDTLLTWTNDAQGGTESALPVVGPVHALAALDWDGDGTDEIAYTTDGALRILEADGTEIDSFPAGGPGDVLAVSAIAGSANERLLFASKLDGISYWLTVVRDGFVETPLLLGNVGLVAMEPGDLNGDGLSDVVLSVQFTSDLILLKNRAIPGSATYSWTTGDFEYVPTGLSLPAPNNHAWPAVADYDNDGDDDILFPLEESRSFALLRGTYIDHEQRVPRVVGGIYTIAPGATIGRLALSTEPPISSSAATHLEIVLWRQETAGSSTTSQAISAAVLQWSGGPNQVLLNLDTVTQQLAAHHATMRLVWVDENDAILAAEPDFNWTHCVDNDTATALGNDFGVSSDDWIDVTPPGDGYTDKGSTVVPLGCVPDFDDDQFPDDRPNS